MDGRSRSAIRWTSGTRRILRRSAQDLWLGCHPVASGRIHHGLSTAPEPLEPRLAAAASVSGQGAGAPDRSASPCRLGKSTRAMRMDEGVTVPRIQGQSRDMSLVQWEINTPSPLRTTPGQDVSPALGRLVRWRSLSSRTRERPVRLRLKMLPCQPKGRPTMG